MKSTFIFILCVCTLQYFTYSNEQVSLHFQNSSHSITCMWVYGEPLNNQSQAFLIGLSQIQPDKRIKVFCGSMKCHKSASLLNRDNIDVEQLRVFKLSAGTALLPWVRKHPINKILSGSRYTQHLQRAMTLAALWQDGGTVIDLDLNAERLQKVIQITKDMKEHTCMLTSTKLPLGLCHMQKRHPFTENLIQRYVAHYMNNAADFDFSKVVKSTIKTYPNQNQVPTGISDSLDMHIGQVSNHDNHKLFGLLSYEGTRNLGDEMQSLAAAHFLPYVDEYLPRKGFTNEQQQNITFIANDWWGNDDFIYDNVPNVLPVTID